MPTILLSKQIRMAGRPSPDVEQTDQRTTGAHILTKYMEIGRHSWGLDYPVGDLKEGDQIVLFRLDPLDAIESMWIEWMNPGLPITASPLQFYLALYPDVRGKLWPISTVMAQDGDRTDCYASLACFTEQQGNELAHTKVAPIEIVLSTLADGRDDTEIDSIFPVIGPQAPTRQCALGIYDFTADIATPEAINACLPKVTTARNVYQLARTAYQDVRAVDGSIIRAPVYDSDRRLAIGMCEPGNPRGVTNKLDSYAQALRIEPVTSWAIVLTWAKAIDSDSLDNLKLRVGLRIIKQCSAMTADQGAPGHEMGSALRW